MKPSKHHTDMEIEGWPEHRGSQGWTGAVTRQLEAFLGVNLEEMLLTPSRMEAVSHAIEQPPANSACRLLAVS